MAARDEIEHILDAHLTSYEPGSDDRSVRLENLLNRFSGLAAELDQLRAEHPEPVDPNWKMGAESERYMVDLLARPAFDLEMQDWNRLNALRNAVEYGMDALNIYDALASGGHVKCKPFMNVGRERWIATYRPWAHGVAGDTELEAKRNLIARLMKPRVY